MQRTDIATGEVLGRATAMAAEITVRAVAPGVQPDALREVVAAALDVFSVVQAACTRFDPTSPLMQANASADRWSTVPGVCFEALREAYRAYLLTAGLFDPRVLGDLLRLGYAKSMAGGVPDSVDAPHAWEARPTRSEWTPQFRTESHEVLIGERPVDLGGIGKGLAVRWCSEQLRQHVGDYLIEAGGDCYCAGHAPGGGAWRIAVEDPSGRPTPLAVLELHDRACATSSVRIRQWRAAGRLVHHLVDPRTGLPGGQGLRSVTVVHTDPAIAEVWSKALFLCGRATIEEYADRQHVAAMWVDDAGLVHMSSAMPAYVIWQAS